MDQEFAIFEKPKRNMRLLIKQVRIIEAGKIGAPVDILIEDGIIRRVASGLGGDDCIVWDAASSLVSIGWFDAGVHIPDPGEEHREDLASACEAATAGGFTGIACLPNTQPVAHSKSEIQYMRRFRDVHPVEVCPIGSVSVGAEGKDLAELYDMREAGAVAFSDGLRPIQDAGLLLRALEYVRSFGGLVINTPHHVSLAQGGQMHEGLVSTQLGLRGLSALSELVMIQRDLSLLAHTGSRLHVHLVSTAGGVALIREAKARGLSVTASVAIANLCFTESVLAGVVPEGVERAAAFDSNWKMLPPLRGLEDMEALRMGLKDGTLDFVCSNHRPWDLESKNVEFPYAGFGITGLETLFSMWCSFGGHDLELPLFIEKISEGPRRVLGLEVPQIREGRRAELTVFNPLNQWIYGRDTLVSKSVNNPLMGCQLKGRVEGTVSGHFFKGAISG